MVDLQSDEEDAINTYNRMYEASLGLSCIAELAAAVIVARAIKDSKLYQPHSLSSGLDFEAADEKYYGK